MDIKGMNLFTSNRSSVTCKYKCGNACDGEHPNQSGNEYFGDITRRSALKAGAVTALVVGGGSALAACTPSNQGESKAGSSTSSAAGSSANKAVESAQGMQFTAIKPNTEDAVKIPEGYEQSVLIAWGDPVFEDAPKFDLDNQTGAAQERQFGFNNDFAALLDHPTDKNRMVYVCSHEYTTELNMFKGYDEKNPTEEQFKVGLAAHGHTVLEVSKVSGSGQLKREFGKLNRRITANTPFKLMGPAAGTDLVKTEKDPEGRTVTGTLNNCSGGITPWGTMLSGEENFDQYFANAKKLTDEDLKKKLKRYGMSGEETTRKWERFDDRFDITKTPNEPNRFGWLVEIDPMDPNSTPVKHTAIGRFKHEAGNIHVTADGTVVCYSGDDERNDYMYKFVSSRKIKEGDKAGNMKILDEGTLYVAKFEGNSPASEIDGSGMLPKDGQFDGKGSWIKLLTTKADGSAESHVDGMKPEEVAVYTRLAADKVKATAMDRPEDIEVNPKSGKVYVALTNNKYRGAVEEGKNYPKVDEANPVKENKNGYVMEITDDHAGTTMSWNLLLVCGDPKEAYTYFGGFDKTKVSPITCPDNLAFDPYGNMWIATDSLNALKMNDGLYAVGLEGANRGETKLFLTVPVGAETCGPIVTKERVMVNVQHPGEDEKQTADKMVSHWPDGGNNIPRPGVVVVWPKKGNVGDKA